MNAKSFNVPSKLRFLVRPNDKSRHTRPFLGDFYGGDADGGQPLAHCIRKHGAQPLHLSDRKDHRKSRPKSESEAMRPEAGAVSTYSDQPIPEKVNVEKIDTPFQPAAPIAKLFEQHAVVRNSVLLPPCIASLFKVRFTNQCFNIVRALTKSKAENSFAIEWPHWCMRASAQREDQSDGTNQFGYFHGSAD